METNSNLLNDIFNPTVVLDEPKREIEDYKPSAEKGRGGVYKSIVRFVAWHKNPNNSVMQKWSCYLVDPLSGKGKTVDCPSSIGESSPIRDMFFQLRNSKSVTQQEKSKIFSSRQTFCALVQIIKDENAPELEGKILRYSFGKKVFEKITGAMRPEYGAPTNPFDIFNGTPFSFVISKVNDFNNYDKCGFINQSMPLQWVDENGKMTPMSMSDDKGAIVKFLQEKSPDLEKYAYKPWDDETKQFVNAVIACVAGNASGNTAPQQPTQPQVNATSVTNGDWVVEQHTETVANTVSNGFMSELPDISTISSDDLPF